MPLAFLLSPPVEEREFQVWAFHNAAEHTAANTALISLGANLNQPLLDPIPTTQEGLDEWLERHARHHDDINSALNLSGSDLTSVDFTNEDQKQAWIRLHFQDHVFWNQLLGLG